MRKLLYLITLSLMLLYGCTTMAKYEEPDFDLVEAQGNIEIRNYRPMIVAQVEVSGERGVAISEGFRLIADYIFGNNQTKTAPSNSSEKIQMTTPVIQQESLKIPMTTPVTQQEKNNNWLVQFVMPKSYTLNSLPKPNNDQVKLLEVPAHKAIVIRFSGTSRKSNLQKHLIKLKKFVDDKKLNIIGEPIYAFYNPPWTLPFLRRNEIMFKLN